MESGRELEMLQRVKRVRKEVNKKCERNSEEETDNKDDGDSPMADKSKLDSNVFQATNNNNCDTNEDFELCWHNKKMHN